MPDADVDGLDIIVQSLSSDAGSIPALQPSSSKSDWDSGKDVGGRDLSWEDSSLLKYTVWFVVVDIDCE